ncbi:hypothetical protein HXX76_007060 [Chlamydomonas incerta]|uniref:Uncharacterized protein n=1 Tax=Chlamydomonas incerta TaxID=51695 RepID=A0A835W1I7_CHLIN|nr:hypothetical protein HXX76_007060 [Chlamydomonas incerta]|eukprot:KAG2435865.1 hypothetical protein HXX76_007060 [Chlamydomonas incerta]
MPVLQVVNLHKALRKPANGPITAPADAVYECLTLLRRPDLDSLAPFFPAGAFDPAGRRVALDVGGQEVEEAGPLAACSGVMDTAARRVLPGHLLRRCRVLSSVMLGDTCQQRVALTACTGEETVFVWRLRRVGPAGGAAGEAGGASSSGGSSSSSSSSGSGGLGSSRDGGLAAPTSPAYFRSSAPAPHSVRRGPAGDGDDEPSTSTSGSSTTTSSGRGARTQDARAAGAGAAAAPAASALLEREPGLESGSGSYASGTGSESDSEAVGSESRNITTDWIVESIARDDSHDDDEMPAPGGPTGVGGGPHPRCSPELVVKAQLAALARGDVVGAASFNLWSRSTSAGWELHLSAFRSLLAQPAYAPLLAAGGAELGPSALPTPRRLLQEVRLTGLRRQAAAAAAAGAGGGGGGGGSCRLVFQLGMQANGCWVVEAIRRVADS